MGGQLVKCEKCGAIVEAGEKMRSHMEFHKKNEPLPFKAFEFVCNVLETPLGHNYRWEPDSPEEKERFNIAHRYEELKRKHPNWSFSMCSLMARSEWLRDWLYENYRRGRKIGED